MFDDVNDLVTDSPGTYLVVLGLVTLDAVFPVAPSEVLLLAGGALIRAGDLAWPLFIPAAACGAVAGDSLLYLVGRRAGPAARRRLFRTERLRQRLATAERVLKTRTWLLIVSDFLPGGRTAAMFAAGVVEVPIRRFYAFVVPGALFWATFYVLLGVAGAEAVAEGGTTALLTSVGIGLVLLIAGELIHRRTTRQKGV